MMLLIRKFIGVVCTIAAFNTLSFPALFATTNPKTAPDELEALISDLESPQLQEFIQLERKVTAMIDIALLTTAAKIVNDYLVRNPRRLSAWSSLCLGTGSWVFGEVAETIYKKVYSQFSHKTLRNALGTLSIGNTTIDKQRLLRRTLSALTLFTFIALVSHHART